MKLWMKILLIALVVPIGGVLALGLILRAGYMVANLVTGGRFMVDGGWRGSQRSFDTENYGRGMMQGRGNGNRENGCPMDNDGYQQQWGPGRMWGRNNSNRENGCPMDNKGYQQQWGPGKMQGRNNGNREDGCPMDNNGYQQDNGNQWSPGRMWERGNDPLNAAPTPTPVVP
jgi:hypothetical protein